MEGLVLKGGYYRTSDGKLYHREVYKKAGGVIPNGWDVHHIDGDRINNVPDNLIAMPPSLIKQARANRNFPPRNILEGWLKKRAKRDKKREKKRAREKAKSAVPFSGQARKLRRRNRPLPRGFIPPFEPRFREIVELPSATDTDKERRVKELAKQRAEDNKRAEEKKAREREAIYNSRDVFVPAIRVIRRGSGLPGKNLRA